jgi:hypothetical protein
MRPWTWAAVLVGAALYAAALNSDLYGATSPYWLSWHVLLRKIYSVAAFTLAGYLLRRALDEWHRSDSPATTVWGMAAYSAAIEVGQAIVGSKEGLAWNAFDVLCGALGGFIALALDRATRKTR